MSTAAPRGGAPRVVFVAAEAVPFSKTGGLGDVAGALPAALAGQGAEVVVLLPFHRSTRELRPGVSVLLPALEVPLGQGTMPVRLLELDPPPMARLRILFVDCPALFDRAGIYGEGGREYADNVFRFGVFCGAVLEAMRALRLHADLLHVHDWQAALVPVLRATRYREDPVVGGVPVVLTIHNLEYQGLAGHEVLDRLALPRSLDHPHRMEYFGRTNALKGGLVFSDFLTTVGRRYAREILTPRFGCGLEGVLRERRRELVGIPNGIDVRVWDPARDPFLRAPYSAAHPAGKAACKEDLQRELGLPVDPGRPLVGFIGRMVEQKGIDLLEEALEGIVGRGVQFAFLGTGQPEYERRMEAAGRRWPGRVAGVVGYTEELAHRYAAGLDMLLVPSRFEPCGLVQLYSLRYGTVPVVHRVGGLADTVVPVTPAAMREGRASGFVFRDHASGSLLRALDRALAFFGRPRAWERLVGLCMRQVWSWDRSAERYVMLFRRVARERGGRPARLRLQPRPLVVTPRSGPFVEMGPPLPRGYGAAVARVLVQSPWWVHVYFEAAGAAVGGSAGGDGAPRRPALRVVLEEEGAGVVGRTAVGEQVGECWFLVRPGSVCRAAVVAEGADGRETPLVVGPPVRVPHAGPGRRAVVAPAAEPPDVAARRGWEPLQEARPRGGRRPRGRRPVQAVARWVAAGGPLEEPRSEATAGPVEPQRWAGPPAEAEAEAGPAHGTWRLPEGFRAGGDWPGSGPGAGGGA